jgi:hypothetical protein
MYSSSTTNASKMIMLAGGVDKIFFNTEGDSFINGGNVGIGTASPSEKLEVSGNVSATGNITGSNLSGTNTGDQDLSTYALLTDITGTNSGTNTGDQDLSGYLLNTTDTFTGNLNIVGQIIGNNPLILSAGESSSYNTGQTGEILYVNAEGGLQVNSSPDNWATAWAGRKTATINNTLGDSSFPGAVSATGAVTGSNLSGTNTGDQDLSGYSLTSHSHNVWDLASNRTSINIDTAGADNFWGYKHATGTTDGTHAGSYHYVASFGDKSQGIQLSHNFGSGTDLYYRGGTDNLNSENGANVYKDWRKLLTTEDISGYATETYVDNAVSDLVDTAPATLDTLNELAAALGDDPNFATTVTNSIATKLPLAGGTMSGNIIIDQGAAAANPRITFDHNNFGTSLYYIEADRTNDYFRIVADGSPRLTLSSTAATFSGPVSANNLSGTNTGDQDLSGYALTTALSGYLLNTTDTLTGTLTIASAAVPFKFEETGYTGEGKYWRHVQDGGGFRLDSCTTGDGLFTPYVAAIQLSKSGEVKFGGLATAGFMKTDAAGNVSIDTTSYSTFDGAYSSLTGTPTIPSGNAIIDWTIDQGATNINTGNYTNTTYTNVSEFTNDSGYLTASSTQSKYLRSDANDRTTGNLAVGSIDATSGIGSTRILKVSSTGNSEVNVDHTDGGTASDIGLFSFSRNGDHLAHIKGTHDGSTSSAFLSFHTQTSGGSYANAAANERMRITSTGNIGIGTLSPSAKLDVNGVVKASNFVLNSDKRLKTKIKEIETNHIDVKWKNFELKDDLGVKRSGVIAQELEEVHPEFVRTDDKGMKSVAYIDLLIAKNAELEARLEKLERLLLDK